MKIETLLPLGKTDPGLRASDQPLDITDVGKDAELVERLGFDSLVVEETKDDPYMVMALAAQATSRVGLATSVAMAFPRSPVITAMSAWTVQKLSSGRFTLGLGSQVRGHIVRRYGLDYSPPGPWMRDYVKAVRAIWDCWQHGSRLDFHSDHYDIDLMVPLFNPGPIDQPDIPIHIAAVNRVMCRVAGEVADGIRLHPVCTPKYINEVTKPALAEGAEKAGRDPSEVELCMKPLVATARDSQALEKKIEDVRARIAFYASTPAYRAPFILHGIEDIAVQLSSLSKEQRWEEMPKLISDDVLHQYVTAGTYDEIADKLAERYGGLVDRIEFSIPVEGAEDRDLLANLIHRLQNSGAGARLG